MNTIYSYTRTVIEVKSSVPSGSRTLYFKNILNAQGMMRFVADNLLSNGYEASSNNTEDSAVFVFSDNKDWQKITLKIEEHELL